MRGAIGIKVSVSGGDVNAFVSVNCAVKDIAGDVKVCVHWVLLNLGDFFLSVRGARPFQDVKQFLNDFCGAFAFHSGHQFVKLCPELLHVSACERSDIFRVCVNIFQELHQRDAFAFCEPFEAYPRQFVNPFFGEADGEF